MKEIKRKGTSSLRSREIGEAKILAGENDWDKK
jgi:hypothetical protein